MGKLFSIRKPRIRISKKGGIGLSGGGMRIGGRNAGINISKSGVSASGGVKGLRYNTRKGASLGCPFRVLLLVIGAGAPITMLLRYL